MTTLLQQAQAFAQQAHVGQTYGNDPYTAHLQAVETVLRRFQVADESLLAAAWLHDVLEDTAITQDELLDHFGPAVVGPVVAVTEPKGLVRSARHAVAWPVIRASLRATMLKLADRIANVESGGKTRMYVQEHPMFRAALYEDTYRYPVLTAMWTHLDALIAQASQPTSA